MNRTILSFVMPTLVAGLVACTGQVRTEPASGAVDGGAPQNGGGGNNGTTCTVAADCGTNTAAKCGRVCQDGSNPCRYACSSTHQCVMQGCPEDNAPSGCMPKCTGADICVRTQVLGGAFFAVDDAGACPMGRHPEGAECVADPSYACEPKPALCGDIFDCSCTSSVCKGGSCTGTTRHEIDCELAVP